MKSAFQKVCTLGGKCFNIVTPTLGRVTPFVQQAVAATSELERLELDVATVKGNAKTFRRVLQRIESYQKTAGVIICSLQDGFDILTNFDMFMEQYKPHTLKSIVKQGGVKGKVVAGTSEAFRRAYPNWYRAELHKFNGLMQATLANISLEVTTVNAQLQAAKTLPLQEQAKVLQQLKSFSCDKLPQPTTTYSTIYRQRKATRRRTLHRGVRGGLYYKTKQGRRRYVKRMATH